MRKLLIIIAALAVFAAWAMVAVFLYGSEETQQLYDSYRHTGERP